MFIESVSHYGIFFFLGIVSSVFIAVVLGKKCGVDFFDYACAAVYVMIGAIIGAKLLFVVVTWKDIMRLQLSLVEILQGGFVFYGGLLGGLLGLIVYSKQFKVDVKDYADIFATVLPLGHCFGRIGCTFAGCCYGIPYNGWGCICYKTATNVFTPTGVCLFPIQIIEAMVLLVLFGLLQCLFFRRKQKGNIALIYLSTYALLRFILEFFRGDTERGELLTLSTSQWISIALLCMTFIYWLKCRKGQIKNPHSV